MPRPLAYEEERRLKTGHLVAALALVVLGVLIGWVTDSGEGTDRPGGGRADVGPTRTVDGISVGYERSREGAVAAALGYGELSARPEFVASPQRRRAILDVIATPEVARQYEEREASLAALAETPLYRAARDDAPSIWQITPLGYRVERYSGEEAVVLSWSLGTFGAGNERPQAVFSTNTSRLRWDGDWRLTGGSVQDGPTPAVVDDAQGVSVDQVHKRLRGLQGLRHVP